MPEERNSHQGIINTDFQSWTFQKHKKIIGKIRWFKSKLEADSEDPFGTWWLVKKSFIDIQHLWKPPISKDKNKNKKIYQPTSQSTVDSNL